ncbi:UvrD-helicase domain-containing protein [Spirulina sp. CS-785/01]|uniref:UvrD-helicase domain-containing protein n=1 Tax=Spirulina sp. CS-785/01 TaxID=3021716 RepID=UPI002330A5AF|nr:UvrD-helicase domain-containing protein [Spirulina sp. CS-785/01]MDB9314652.1 UvrD-helicase domain-containing protein [Spirulina sp. CS-785/01]
MGLTPEQEQAAFCPRSVVVTAGAGTGKTHMLAERYLYYLRQGVSPLELVAVTFTEKAALELRSRIRSLITQAFPQRRDILAELEAAQISTLHALASRICHEHPQAAGIPADFSILENREGQLWLADCRQQVISQLPFNFFEVIPYSQLSSVLDRLLDDPYTSHSALKQRRNWEEILQELKESELQQLQASSQWQEAKAILSQSQGKAGDKLENLRQEVLDAIISLESKGEYVLPLKVLDGIDTRKGSKKAWDPTTFTLVKETLKQLRERVRKSLPLLTLELGEVDEQLETMLSALQEAYQEVYTALQEKKQAARVLTFADTEIYALQALNSSSVRDYYQQRWGVFLVDEFQDTNPTQAAFLEQLTHNAELTLVGDKKQSIYGFRRADVRVFDQFRDTILQGGGEEVQLTQSFRTQASLLTQINQIFAPLLQEIHQDLTATRPPFSPAFPPLQVFTVESENKAEVGDKNQRRQVEATHIANQLAEILAAETLIWDKTTGKQRPIQPQDMAILTRTWQPLEDIETAIAAKTIPVVLAGGGNLFNTREAKDVWALLRFLADPQDNIALVALLRSPFFAVSDRLLVQLKEQHSKQDSKQDSKQETWWETLQTSGESLGLQHPVTVLNYLLGRRYEETPSRLLQDCDRKTGYTGIIANLPKAKRRLADWQGMRQLVQELEQGTEDLFGVVRRLKQLIESDSDIPNSDLPRPPLEAENAVSLMTIHKAKGLEWPLVVVADLTHQKNNKLPSVYFDSDYGVALQCPNDQGETEKPVLYHYLKHRHDIQTLAEDFRVLYVAMTRAKDYLILTAPDKTGGDITRLSPGLEAANIPVTVIPYLSLSPHPYLSPPTPPDIPLDTLLTPVGSGIFELPVTALSVYHFCPKRFQFQFINGHPGLGEGLPKAMQVGSLTHVALERNITTVSQLSSFLEGEGSDRWVEEALQLAQRFRSLDQYKGFRDSWRGQEEEVTVTLSPIQFNGRVDLWGEGWVLDYKTDEVMTPQQHRFQLWMYAKALGVKDAYIAYLRYDQVYLFSRLEEMTGEVEQMVDKIMREVYVATPSRDSCSVCPYTGICEDAFIMDN